MIERTRIRTVCGYPLAIIVSGFFESVIIKSLKELHQRAYLIYIQGKCLSVGQRHSSNLRFRLVLIYIIAQMQDIIDRVLFRDVPISVKITLGLKVKKHIISKDLLKSIDIAALNLFNTYDSSSKSILQI